MKRTVVMVIVMLLVAIGAFAGGVWATESRHDSTRHATTTTGPLAAPDFCSSLDQPTQILTDDDYWQVDQVRKCLAKNTEAIEFCSPQDAPAIPNPRRIVESWQMGRLGCLEKE